MEKAKFYIEKLEETLTSGTYVMHPLPRGFGQTMGNVLRRVLLSSLEGAAITHVKIKGVTHPFVTIKGMKEDVLNLLLNLKQVRFNFSAEDEQKLILKKKGKGPVTAGNIEDSGVCSVVNTDLYLGELADDGVLDVEIYVNKGVGYVPAEDKEQREYGMLALDSIFTPVVNVSFKVEGARVGRKTNYDKLVLSIVSDGSIAPRAALDQAAITLVNYFQLLVEGGMEIPKATENKGGSQQSGSGDEKETMMVDELDLPTRVINALIKHGIENVSQLAKMTDEDYAKVRGLGKKSVEELKVKLQELKLI